MVKRYIKKIYLKFRGLFDKIYTKRSNNTIEPILEQLPYTKEQFDLFQKLKVGDVVFAKMPISKKELEKIEESHRNRPYVIVRKNHSQLIAYHCSSTLSPRLKSYEYYPITFGDKTSYIYLDKAYQLPIDNLLYHFNHLDASTLALLNKRIILSKTNRNPLPHFKNIPKSTIQKGDLIMVNEDFFLVNDHYHDELYVHKIYRIGKQSHADKYSLKLNGKYFSISYSERNVILKSINDIRIIDILDQKQWTEFNFKKDFYFQSLKRKKVTQEENPNRIKYYRRFPLGQTFQFIDKTYMYICHCEKQMLGLDIDEPNALIRMEDLKYLHKKWCMTNEEIDTLISSYLETGKDISNIQLVQKVVGDYKKSNKRKRN